MINVAPYINKIDQQVELVSQLCLAIISHIASLSKAGNELGTEYFVAIGFFALVPLLMLFGLKFLEKRTLKAARRAAAASTSEDAVAGSGVAVVQEAAQLELEDITDGEDIEADEARQPNEVHPLYEEHAQQYKVVVQTVTIRAGFGHKSAKVGTLRSGEVVDVLEGRKNGYGVLRIRAEQGWLSVTSTKGTVFLEAVDRRQTARDHARAARGRLKFRIGAKMQAAAQLQGVGRRQPPQQLGEPELELEEPELEDPEQEELARSRSTTNVAARIRAAQRFAR
jgi:hypothetical protein